MRQRSGGVMMRVAAMMFGALVAAGAAQADAVYPHELSAKAGTVVARKVAPGTTARAVACTALCGSPVTYTAFDDTTHALLRIDGHHTALLFPEAMLADPRFTATARRRFLDMSDYTYDAMRVITGAEPSGDGRAIVALLGTTDPTAVARGRIGAKGIEIYANAGFPYSTQPLASAAQGRFDGLVAHEFGHNYDMLWFEASVATFDPPHFFTLIMQKELSLHTRWQETVIGSAGGFGAFDRSSEELRHRLGHEYLQDFFRQPDANFPACVTTRACGTQSAQSTAASIFFRIAEGHDAGFMRRYFAHLRAQAPRGTGARAGIASLDVHLVALSLAAGENLACVGTALGWQPTPGALLPLANLPPSPRCRDGDGDGFIALVDADDGDATTHPRAADVADGRDNDDDGIVDEVPLTLAQAQATRPSYPFAIRDTIAPDAADVRIALPPPPGGRIVVTSCAYGGTVGATLATGSLGEIQTGASGGAGTACSRKPLLLVPGAGATDAALTIATRPGAGVTGGAFDVVVHGVPSLPMIPTDVLIDRVAGAGGDRIRFAATDGRTVPVDARARLWRQGEGFVADVPFAAGAFVLPAADADRTVHARVTVVADDQPVLAPSELHALSPAVAPAPLSGIAGGAWFDPDRGGEGWQLERARVGGNDVLLVAYYTQASDLYDDDVRRTPWFVGAAPLPAGANHVDVRLSAARAGRGGFATHADAYAAADARLAFGADGRIRASVVASNGELAQSLLQPLLSPPDGGGPFSPGLAGAWSAEGVPGEGAVVSFARDGAARRVLVAWYGYCGAIEGDGAACDHAARWAVGSATYGDDAEAIAVDLFTTRGARFGHAFVPADGVTRRAGTVTLSWPDCDRLRWQYRADAGHVVDATLRRVASPPADRPCVAPAR